MKYCKDYLKIDGLFSKVGQLYFQCAFEELVIVFSKILNELNEIKIIQSKQSEKTLKINNCLFQLEDLKQKNQLNKESALLSEQCSIVLEIITDTYLWLLEIAIANNEIYEVI